jgi:hypothetical protein
LGVIMLTQLTTRATLESLTAPFSFIMSLTCTCVLLSTLPLLR